MQHFIWGLEVVLGVQLLLVAMVNFRNGYWRNLILAHFILVLLAAVTNTIFSGILYRKWFLFPVLALSNVMLYGPLLLLYVQSVLLPTGKIKRWYWRWIISLSIVAALIMTPQYLLDSAHPTAQQVILVISTILIVLCYIQGQRLINGDHMNSLKVNSRKRFKAFYLIANVYLFGHVLGFLLMIADSHWSGSHTWLNWGANLFYPYGRYLLFFGFALILIIYGLTEVSFFKSMVVPRKIQLAPASDLPQDFVRYLETEKPFLKRNIRLHDIAIELNTDGNLIMEIIQQQGYDSLASYLNYFRVQEFIGRLQHAHKYDIVSIALDCGFRSKSTFYRVFKQITGITPTEYLANYPQQLTNRID